MRNGSTACIQPTRPDDAGAWLCHYAAGEWAMVRTLTVLDLYTRESLAWVSDRSLTHVEVAGQGSLALMDESPGLARTGAIEHVTPLPISGRVTGVQLAGGLGKTDALLWYT